MKPAKVSVSRSHSGAYSLEWSKGAVWLITLCGMVGTIERVRVGVEAAKSAPNISRVVVVCWSVGITMVMQYFCGQMSTSWGGSGCYLLTKRPRCGAKSGRQQQQTSKRGPSSS